MKKKLFGFALVIGLGFGLNATVSAQDNTAPAPDRQERMDGKNKIGKMRGEKRGGRGAMMGGLQQLNLTDAQREQIRSIRRNARGNQDSREEMQALAQARRAGTLTADQQERFQQLREQRRAQSERIQQQILAVLTPEQRRQWEQMRESNGDDRMNERRERRRNRQMNEPMDN